MVGTKESHPSHVESPSPVKEDRANEDLKSHSIHLDTSPLSKRTRHVGIEGDSPQLRRTLAPIKENKAYED